MSQLVIRRAGERDLEAVLGLYRHLHVDDPLPSQSDALRETWRAMCASHWNRVLLALREGVPVATCGLVVVANLTRGARPYALIENVVTHPDFRRQGAAAALLAAAREQALAAGCYKVMLMTSRHDEATLRFYRRAGFSSEDKTAFVARL